MINIYIYYSHCEYFPSHISAGDSPAVPCGSQSDPRKGRLHPVWLPETSAHVPHGVPWHDQQGPLPRSEACTVLNGINNRQEKHLRP